MRKEWKNGRSEISILRLADEVRKKMPSSSVSDEEVLKLCRIAVEAKDELYYLSSRECEHIIKQVFSCLRCELEILQEYADDPAVSEIMVNGKDNIFIEKNGNIERAPVRFETTRQLEQIIQRLAAKVGREINDLNPILDARLSDGSRINAENSNIAIGGPVLTIRKFTKNRMTMEDLIAYGDISREAAEFLCSLVRARYNIFVSGGTSSGKTTFLNVLSDFIPPEERIIVIEDSAELAIRNHENLVRMEAKPPNAQGRGEITMSQLVKASLRARPDRVIIGECRGAEAIDMLAAMSTGHDGSLSTGHANSAMGMISRLETMHISNSGFPMQAVRSQIAQAIEIFVHMSRFPEGHRRVTEISEVAGIKDGIIQLNTIYKYIPEKGLVREGNGLIHCDKLRLYDGLYGKQA